MSYSNLQWLALVELFGDTKAGLAIVSSLVRTAIRKNVPIDQAHDVVQEALFRALAGTRRWDCSRGDVVDFLTSAVWGVAGNEWQKTERRLEFEESQTVSTSSETDDHEVDRIENYPDPDAGDPAQHVEDQNLLSQIFKVLDKIRAKDVNVRIFARLYYCGYTLPEIAEALNISAEEAQNIKKRHSYAMKYVAAKLDILPLSLLPRR
jgi:RNA polymerase sigma factor (sigma-70 family)